MHQRSRRLIVALALVCLPLVPTPESAGAGAIRTGSVTGWVPYWETTTGARSLETAAGLGLMTEVMPFWFSAVDATTVRSVGTTANLLTVVRAARAKGQLVLPSITDGTGRLALQKILLDAVSRTAHADRLVTLVMTGADGIPYDGIDLDYEGFAFSDGRASWAATRQPWLDFLSELRTKLNAQGKLLSVTVPPIWDNGAAGYTVYGTPGDLVARADRVRLMVYDWSVASPGPIAPMSWVRNVIAYVQQTVPDATQRAKVWLGVPAYGRSWAKVTGECPAVMPSGVARSTTSVEMQNGPALAASHGASMTEYRDSTGAQAEQTFSWDVVNPTTGGLTFSGAKTVTPVPDPYVPPPAVANDLGKPADGTALAPAVRIAATQTVTVTVTCTIKRVVHIPDDASIVERSRVAEAGGLGGIVIWALGYEPLDLWSTLASS